MPEMVMDFNAFDKAIERLLKRNQGLEKGFPICWPGVKKEFGGYDLIPGVYQIVGLAGAYKTATAMGLLIGGARDGHPGAYIGAEMGQEDVLARMASFYSTEKKFGEVETDWGKIMGGKIKRHYPECPCSDCEKDLERLSAMLGLVRERMGAGLVEWIIKPPTELTAPYLTSLCEKVGKQGRKRGKTPLVVVDYLQLLPSPPESRLSLRESIKEWTVWGRQRAVQNNVAVIFLSSTARSYYDLLRSQGQDADQPWNKSAERLIGCGKESGETEYSADAVFVMVKNTVTNDFHLGIAKNRLHPGRGWAVLHFDGSRVSDGYGRRHAVDLADGRTNIENHFHHDTWQAWADFVSASGLNHTDAGKLKAQLLEEGKLEEREGEVKYVAE